MSDVNTVFFNIVQLGISVKCSVSNWFFPKYISWLYNTFHMPYILATRLLRWLDFHFLPQIPNSNSTAFCRFRGE